MKIAPFIIAFIFAISCSNQGNTDTSSYGAYPNAVENFNYAIGTQAIDQSYKFTEESGLVEMAKGIREMGSNILKIVLETGPGKYNDIDYKASSLKDLVSNEPSFKEVLDMDFSYYFMWAYGPADFTDGMSDEDNNLEYQSIYDLASHLLKQYNNTGKTFYLGNWEGDWHLVNDFDKETWNGARADIKEEWTKSMADWFNIRQKAVDDAKRDSDYSNVNVFHYIEVCLVKPAVYGLPRLTNKVLPITNPDYVSYSSYDITNIEEGRDKEKLRSDIFQMLDFVEENLKPKEGIKGKRVLIGEYGYPFGPGNRSNQVASAEEQDSRSREVISICLEWGCPFILQWAFYNNEVDNEGGQIGFWMINDKNEKQAIYYTHQKFYSSAKEWVNNYLEKNGTLPSRDEYNKMATELIGSVSKQANR